LSSIEADLSFSAQALQWVISAYALTFAGLLLLGGQAADLRVLGYSAIKFGVTSVVLA
jgi:MFS family permease